MSPSAPEKSPRTGQNRAPLRRGAKPFQLKLDRSTQTWRGSCSIPRDPCYSFRTMRNRGDEVPEPVIPYTGQEFLDSLDDGREVWIYGERVGQITRHPAFRNAARMLA